MRRSVKRPIQASVAAAACVLLGACGASNATATTTTSGGAAATGGGGASAIPAGTTAQAQLAAYKSCKPISQPTGEEHWLVTAGTGNPTYTLPKATPTVGTSLASWPSTPMVVLGDCQDTEAWVFAAGDSSNLYLAVQVDSTFSAVDGTLTAPWSGDCVQLGFDPQDQMTSASYGPNDVEGGMALIGGQPFLFINDTDDTEVTPAAISGGKVSITRANGITLYEAAIPWTALGPTVNPTFGFNLAFGAGGADYQAPNWGFEWTQGLIESKSPSDFAQLTFKS